MAKITIEGEMWRTRWLEPWGPERRFRIWLFVTPFGIFQRHEWLFERRNESFIEEWIPAATRRVPDHYEPVPEDELQDCVYSTSP